MDVMKLKGSINNQLVSHTSNNPKNGVPSTTAKWKHNVLVYYVDAGAPNLEGLVLCNTSKWDILWFISDRKSCCLCAFHNSGL